MKKRQPIMVQGLFRDEINYAGLLEAQASNRTFMPPESAKQKVKHSSKKE